MTAAVLWDFGGVITTSPFEAFNRYEAEKGLPRDLIRTVNAILCEAADLGASDIHVQPTHSHALVRYPWVTGQVMARIHCQAIQLWRKRVPFHRKPPFDPERGSMPT